MLLQNRKATESKLVPKLGAAAAAFNDEVWLYCCITATAVVQGAS